MQHLFTDIPYQTLGVNIFGLGEKIDKGSYMGIGERIRSVRKQLGLSQVEFAKKLGISQTHLSDIENEKVKIPDRILKLISRMFGISYKWLKTGKGEIWEEEKFPETEDELIEWIVRQVINYLRQKRIKPTYRRVYRLSEIVYKRIKPIWEKEKEKLESKRLFSELEKSHNLYKEIEEGE